jgi:hypothetical protein
MTKDPLENSIPFGKPEAKMHRPQASGVRAVSAIGRGREAFKGMSNRLRSPDWQQLHVGQDWSMANTSALDH